jgi:hypothetical protein
MKRHAEILAATALVLTVEFSTQAQQSQTPAKVFEGTLVDSKCYLSSGAVPNDHGGMKECGTMCLKGGTPGGLLMADKSFKIVIAPSLALAPHVGQTVRVTGAEKSGVLVPTKIEVKKGNTWEVIKIDGMM